MIQNDKVLNEAINNFSDKQNGQSKQSNQCKTSEFNCSLKDCDGYVNVYKKKSTFNAEKTKEHDS